MTPEQREHAQERFEHWRELSPEQRELARKRWHRYRELTPEQQQRVREGYHGYKKLTPEQRRRMRERWDNATPEERQNGWKSAGRSANAGSSSRRRRHPNYFFGYFAASPLGGVGIFFVLVPGLAQLITK